MIEPRKDPLALYLLHFEPPLGRFAHYVGSTPLRRLNRRMREHLTGQGASLVRRAVAAGCSVYLASVEIIPDRAAEHRRKTAGHHHRRCRLCSHGLHGEQPLTLPNGPGGDPDFQPLGWSRGNPAPMQGD